MENEIQGMSFSSNLLLPEIIPKYESPSKPANCLHGDTHSRPNFCGLRLNLRLLLPLEHRLQPGLLSVSPKISHPLLHYYSDHIDLPKPECVFVTECSLLSESNPSQVALYLGRTQIPSVRLQ